MRKSLIIPLSIISAILLPQISLAYVMPKDVPLDTYYYQPVRQAIDQGIIGETDYFYPSKNLTRAQFVDWFVKVLGVSKIYPSTASFTDVSKYYWGYSSIETAKSLKLVAGTQDAEGMPTGKFEPNALVNRAQAAVIIMKAFMHLTEKNVTFPDLGNVQWAVDAIKRAAAAAFFAGYPNGTYGPANTIIRAEGITVFMKIYSKLQLKELGTSFE